MHEIQKYLWALALLLLIGVGGPSFAVAQGFTAEVFAGTSWSLPTQLSIRQEGYDPIQFTARYRTKPWTGAPYYAYRVGYNEWSAELVHHKLYLQNPPPEVEHFEVSHGYNLAMVSRAFSKAEANSIFRAGIGLVIGHPEGKMRGKNVNPAKSFLGGGYHISGVCLQVAVGPKLEVADHWFFRPEAKVSAAWAQMPLAGGGAVTVPNIALHALFGLGYQYRRGVTKEP